MGRTKKAKKRPVIKITPFVVGISSETTITAMVSRRHPPASPPPPSKRGDGRNANDPLPCPPSSPSPPTLGLGPVPSTLPGGSRIAVNPRRVAADKGRGPASSPPPPPPPPPRCTSLFEPIYKTRETESFAAEVERRLLAGLGSPCDKAIVLSTTTAATTASAVAPVTKRQFNRDDPELSVKEFERAPTTSRRPEHQHLLVMPPRSNSMPVTSTCRPLLPPNRPPPDVGPSPPPPPPLPSSPGSLSTKCLSDQRWFHGSISRETAEHRLAQYLGFRPGWVLAGLFLVREKAPGLSYVISILNPTAARRQIEHLLIARPFRGDGSRPAPHFQVNGLNHPRFVSVVAVVHALCSDADLCTVITHRPGVLCQQVCHRGASPVEPRAISPRSRSQRSSHSISSKTTQPLRAFTLTSASPAYHVAGLRPPLRREKARRTPPRTKPKPESRRSPPHVRPRHPPLTAVFGGVNQGL